MAGQICVICKLFANKWETLFKTADGETGQPLAGARIAVAYGDPVLTGTDGSVVVKGLRQGTYSYTVDHDGYGQLVGTFKVSKEMEGVPQ